MGFLIGNNKLKRNKIMRRRSTNRRLNRNMMCRAQRITEKLSNDSWKGKTCFLLGGGPSLKDFDFNVIKNYPTIGVNKSFIKFPTTINYAMDVRFYDLVTTGDLQQEWLNYKGVKLFLKRSAKFGFDSSVYVVNNLDKKTLSLDISKGIWGGNNSGFGALIVACALGCKRVGLLGYDLKVQKKQRGIETHWHGGYGLGRGESFQSKLDKFKMCFEEFAPTVSKEGIMVVNLNLDSALECFLKEDIKTFLK